MRGFARLCLWEAASVGRPVGSWDAHACMDICFIYIYICNIYIYIYFLNIDTHVNKYILLDINL